MNMADTIPRTQIKEEPKTKPIKKALIKPKQLIKKEVKKEPVNQPPKKLALSHPKYIEMIVESLTKLKDRSGTSRQVLLKYIMENYKVSKDIEKVRVPLKLALKKGVSVGTLKMAREAGKGSASYKVGEKFKEKKPLKKVKKPSVKESAKPKKKVTKTKDSKQKMTDVAKAKKTSKKIAKKTVAKKTAVKKLVAKKTLKKVV